MPLMVLRIRLLWVDPEEYLCLVQRQRDGIMTAAEEMPPNLAWHCGDQLRGSFATHAAKAQLSHGSRAATSALSTVGPVQMRSPGGASR